MGMQACNLQNLPENYVMRFCAYQLLKILLMIKYQIYRDVPRYDMATDIIRCWRS